MSESSRCPNCGEERSGQFCAHCGQKDQPLRQSTLYFLRHAFNEYFGIDGRLWITLRLLLFRPGRLTAEHLKGRRKRYLAPLRLYLTATVLFFFLLSALDPAETLERKIRGSARDSTMVVSARLDAVQGALDSLSVRIDSLRQAAVKGEPDGPQSSHQPDALSDGVTDSLSTGDLSAAVVTKATDPSEDGIRLNASLAEDLVLQRRLEFQRSVLETYPPDSTIRLGDLIDASELLYRGPLEDIQISGFGEQGSQSGPMSRVARARNRTEMAAALSGLARSIIERIPIVMFLMLPVFAMLMKLVYVRRGWYYSEHLIFALHNHAVAFIGFTVIAVLVAIAGNPRWVTLSAAGILLLLNVYFFVAQKHVYGQGWIRTFTKYALVFVSYWSVMIFFGLSVLVLLGSFLA